MKKASILIAQICAVLIAVLVLIALAKDKGMMDEHTPQVSTTGLCHPEIAIAETTAAVAAEPVKSLYSEADITVLAQMLWGEARGCSVNNQMKCVWCVLNRVDNECYPDTIIDVVSQSGQFHGYSPTYPVTDELRAIALDVCQRWSLEKQGFEITRELGAEYLWFTGDGAQNWFRSEF